MKISILGLGWLGLPLAHHLKQAGHQIKGSYSNPKRKPELDKENIDAYPIHLTDKEIIGQWKPFIEDSELMIVNIPPRHKDDPKALFSNKIKVLISQCPVHLKIIFVSSTSVYGNLEGLITEQNEPKPTTLNGIELLKSEQLLQNHFNHTLTIIRFAGLIGPNRNPGNFIAGKTNLPNPKGPINVIHQKDCIQIIEGIIQNNTFGEIFNGCSTLHPERQDYYTIMANKLNQTPPTFVEHPKKTIIKTMDNSKSINLLGIQYSDIFDL